MDYIYRKFHGNANIEVETGKAALSATYFHISIYSIAKTTLGRKNS